MPIPTRPGYLLDSSAFARLIHPPAVAMLAPWLKDGLVATCGATDLRVFSTLPDPSTRNEILAVAAKTLLRLPTAEEDFRRALAVHVALFAEGRAVADWSCLLVAAVAQRHAVTVVHYSADFDLIAKVTGQPTERLP